MRFTVAALVSLAIPLSALSQSPDETQGQYAWSSELGHATGNVLVHAVAGGVLAFARDGDFSEGFVRGAVGGGIGYAGKRVSVSGFPGAGLLGRTINGVGASVATSPPEQGWVPPQLVLPTGPFWFRIDTSTRRLSVRLDLPSAYWIAYGLANPRLRLDLGRSAGAGTPVFVTEESELRDHGGVAAAGVIFLSTSEPDLDAILAHELVHVLQYDSGSRLLTHPVDEFVGEWIGTPVTTAQSFGHIGFSNLALWPLAKVFAPIREAEATFLERHR